MTTKDKNEKAEYILKKSKENNIKFVRLWFTDILGMLKKLHYNVR